MIAIIAIILMNFMIIPSECYSKSGYIKWIHMKLHFRKEVNLIEHSLYERSLKNFENA